MIAIIRAALVIARRDYIATVWSRTFILFLIGPLFPILFGVMFTAVGSRMKSPPPPPVIAIITPAPEGAQLRAAQTRLRDTFGPAAVPEIRIVQPDRKSSQASNLLKQPSIDAVLTGYPKKPVLLGSRGAISIHRNIIALMIQDAKRDAALNRLSVTPPLSGLNTAPIDRPQPPRDDGPNLARGGQVVLLMLTMILAGMLLSNLLEEKSNKVIEVLAAAVPVDAIFFGKLIAMLGMSLTGITAWAVVTVSGIAVLKPELFATMGIPAVGWPAFIALGIVYFIASYLLLGALFLGIGAQAGSVREVQTMSMPITMGQLVIFGLSSTAIDDLNGPLGLSAAVFPWSSPFAMLARGAMESSLWPHLLAIGWQAFWVGMIIRIGAGMFRRSVLKSGGGRKFWRRKAT